MVKYSKKAQAPDVNIFSHNKKNIHPLPDIIYLRKIVNVRWCKSQLCDIFHQHLIRANIYTLTVTLYFSSQQYFISKLFIQVARSKCQTVGFLLARALSPLNTNLSIACADREKFSRGEIRGIILFPKRLGDPRPIF